MYRARRRSSGGRFLVRSASFVMATMHHPTSLSRIRSPPVENQYLFDRYRRPIDDDPSTPLPPSSRGVVVNSIVLMLTVFVSCRSAAFGWKSLGAVLAPITVMLAGG